MSAQEHSKLDDVEQGLLRYRERTGRAVAFDRVDMRDPKARATYRAFCSPAFRSRLKPAAAELLALRLAIKPMLRLLPRRSEWSDSRLRFEAEGFVTVRGAHDLDEALVDGRTTVTDGTRDARVVAYVGRDHDQIREALEVDERLSSQHLDQATWADLTSRLGMLLGYPPCCVEAFVARASKLDNPGLVAAAANRSSRFDARLNNTCLGAFHLLPWAPCSYDCEASLAWARPLDKTIGNAFPGDARIARRALSAPRIYVDDRRQIIFDGRVDGVGCVGYRAVHTPWAMDGNRAEVGFEWAFFADVVAVLLAGDGVQREGGRWVVKRGDMRVAELELPADAVWLPFAGEPG